MSDESDVRVATAPYQKDFPYERGEEAQVTRREFCNFLGLTSAALFLAPRVLRERLRWKRERLLRLLPRASTAPKASRLTQRLTFIFPRLRAESEPPAVAGG